MFMNNFLSGKIYLTLVFIKKIQSFLMRLIIKLLVKWKMNLVEFFLVVIDGKEHNTAKRVNIATEFDIFKDVLFNKKIIRHEMKRI